MHEESAWNANIKPWTHEEAVESTAMIDIPDDFISEESKTGLHPVLKNAVTTRSTTSTRSACQGCCTSIAGKSCIENGKGKVTNFNIIVPSEKGTVYA